MMNRDREWKHIKRQQKL